MRRVLNILFSFILAIAIWQIIVVVHTFSPLLLPSPLIVARAFGEIISTVEGVRHIVSTLFRFGVGLGIGLFGGLVLGLVFGVLPGLKKILWPWVDFARSIPPPALIPLALLFWGLEDTARIILIAFVTSLIMVVCTLAGIETISPTRRAVALNFGYTKYAILYRVLVPEILPQLSAGIRISISFALIVTIVGEMFTGTEHGIGHAILSAQLTYETARMYAYIFIIGLIGYFLNTAYVLLERRYVHWAGK